MNTKNTLFKILKNIISTIAGFRIIAVFAIVLTLSSLVVYSIEHARNEGFVSFFDSFWWTIVTVSTVGYGDRYPFTVGGRIIAICIMFFGMGVMGTITGRIASLLMEHQMKEEKGLLSFEKFKDHFIVCGWKRDMNIFLLDVLDNNPLITQQQIVLINKASPEDINQLRSDERLKNIHYVNGDFIEERDLIRAGVKNAARVLVVADYYTNGDIQQIDSKTVMTVMSIKNCNKKAYVCAELLDNKFEKFLSLSHCDEVLLSRKFSRKMLVSASAGIGTSHVVYALLDGNNGVQMTTIDLPDTCIGHTFDEVKQEYCSSPNMLMIGLMENSGNLMVRKNEALRETQKNSNIEEIITDLRTIKNLSANVPVINPPPDYCIKKFTRAIVIDGSSVSKAVPI